MPMAMSANEREILVDLIGSVQTLATQVLTLHLQLGAMRTLLIRKGTINETELTDITNKLQVSSATDALFDQTAPDVDEVFLDLVRRLESA
jgi:hypothetical protein